MKRLLAEVGAHRLHQRLRRRQQRIVGRRECAGLGHGGAAVAVDHGQHPLRQIAVVVRQVVVHAPDDGPVREIAVAAER